MSREATGSHGQILGSLSYFSQINRSTFWGNLQHGEGFDYYRVLRELASRADGAINSIYDDLQRRKEALIAIPESDRKKLAKQVRSFYDVSSMGGGFGNRCSDCESLLEASGGSSFSFFTQNELQEAAKKIKGSWAYSSTEAETLVERAAKWGIDWAADGDDRKKSFLKEIEDGKGQRFLSEALEAYKKLGNASDLSGRSGYRIGSDSYMHTLERDVFGCTVPTSYSADWGNPQYVKLLREALQEIASQIQHNLEEALRSNWYMRDENAEHMREAIRNLERCGVSTFSLSGIADKLAWYVGGDGYKIRQLQQKLNELGVTDHLTEDGVYGKKTHNAWLDFLDKLEHGTVPTLAWINLTQEKLSGVRLGGTTSAERQGLYNAFIYNDKYRYIHFDPPHDGLHLKVNGKRIPINFPHINIEEQLKGHDPLYDWLQQNYHHYPISDEAYAVLSRMDNVKKVVRIGGKILLVCGIALDALELGKAIEEDLHDADGKLGRTTLSTAASIGGQWGGAALGAKLGAMIGALGTIYAPVTVPILSLAGGIAGSFAGDALAKWVVDITYVGE